MPGAADAILGNVCQAKPSGILLGYPLRNMIEALGIYQYILPVWCARGYTLPHTNVIHTRAHRFHFTYQAVTRGEGIPHPPIPMGAWFKVLGEHNALRSGADERFVCAHTHLPWSWLTHRFFTNFHAMGCRKVYIEGLQVRRHRTSDSSPGGRPPECHVDERSHCSSLILCSLTESLFFQAAGEERLLGHPCCRITLRLFSRSLALSDRIP